MDSSEPFLGHARKGRSCAVGWSLGLVSLLGVLGLALLPSKASAPLELEALALSGLGEFVREQHEQLSAWYHGEFSAELVTIVAGNQASDADSIIAALTYGYLKATLRKDKLPRIFLPIVKCNRQHMNLRQETLAILEHAGVDRKDLIHMDDPEFGPLMQLVDEEDPSFHVILVDHNQADGLLAGKVDGRVVEILDHHKDLEAHEASREVIQFDDTHGVPVVQSACTIIASEILASPTGKGLLMQDDGAVASALLSVIIIDSKDFAGQAPDTYDMTVAKHLKAYIPDAASSKHLQFKWLMDKRMNHSFWSSATLEENLLYDFKQFGSAGFTCGISSTFLSLEDFQMKFRDPEQVGAFDDYVQDPLHPDPDAEVQSSVFVIMLKAAPMHLAIVTNIPGLRHFSKQFLMSSDAKSLELQKAGELHAAGYEVDAYLQGNSKASRKQVGPTCQALLEAFAAS